MKNPENSPISPLGEVGRTGRGFELLKFVDRVGLTCSLQQSSVFDDMGLAPGATAIWLGFDGEARMHLNRAQVAALVEHLANWLRWNTFELEPREGWGVNFGPNDAIRLDPAQVIALADLLGSPPEAPHG